MKMRARSGASASIFAVVVLAVSQSAAASTLSLNYEGLTGGSSALGSNPIALETPFSISAIFSPSAPLEIGTPIPGISYAVSSIDIEVGGVTYSDPSDQFGIVLFTQVAGTAPYVPELIDLGSGTAFAPAYTGVTNSGFSGFSPTPTGFTGYSGSIVFNELQFDTTAGSLSVDYLPGLKTSITDTSAVPEGSSFSYLAIGMAVLGLGAVFGRKTLTAGFSANPL